MPRGLTLVLLGSALLVLPEGVLGITGASEPWEFDVVRWSGLTLVLLGLAVAAARRQGLAILRSRGTVLRQAFTLVLAAAYLVSTRSFFLLVAFCALVHLTLHVAMPVLEGVHSRAKIRARYR